MNCAETHRLMNAYVDGELDLQGGLAVEGHLQECRRCRASLEGLNALRAAVTRACAPAVAPASLCRLVQSNLRTSARPAAGRAARANWLLAAPGLAALLLGLWIVLARPWQVAASPDGLRVVYHLASAENIDATLRTLKNHLDDTPGLRVVVVAHNDGIAFLLQGAKDDAGRPYAPLVREFRQRGVDFRVCTNTLTRRNIDSRAVIGDAVLVPSGIAEISRLQGREGYSYLRL